MATFRLNRAEYERLFFGPTGPVFRHLDGICRRTRNEAVRRCPVDTGRLRGSLSYNITHQGTLLVGRVGSRVSYARYVHEGTGIYGRRGRMIVPINRKRLRFRPGRSSAGARRGGSSPERRGGWVYARAVRGMPPRRFLTDALRTVSPYPVMVVR